MRVDVMIGIYDGQGNRIATDAKLNVFDLVEGRVIYFKEEPHKIVSIKSHYVETRENFLEPHYVVVVCEKVK